MNQAKGQQSTIGQLLQKMGDGDAAAVNALIQHAGERLTRLTRHMLGNFPGVRRWAETGDVFQNALLRLLNALRDVKPRSARDFFGLATLQIRRELLDLARHFHGPEGIGANLDSRATVDSGVKAPAGQGDSQEPSTLAQWTELHEQIGRLPDEERAVVDLVFYQGLAQSEAAALLNLSLRTLQRRWHGALLKLHRYWKGEGR
jgi:RNA polymerase sigma-70 factor (ECF subfamily)